MCVLVFHHRTRDDAPLVLLHNREEAYDRAFDGPRLQDVATGIVAPRDRMAGGTWIGMNRWGLVVAIANRHGEEVEGTVRSRGLLVADLLRAHRAADALRMLARQLARIAYAGFHVLVADGEEACVVRHRGTADPRPLDGGDVFEFLPGAYVLTNRHDPGTIALPDAAWPDPAESLGETLGRLGRVAGDRGLTLAGGHRMVKRGRRYGTVCSALIAPPHFLFAAGPPDRTEFLPVPGTRPASGGGGGHYP